MDVDNPPSAEADAMMETDPAPAPAPSTLERKDSSIDPDGDEQMDAGEYDEGGDVELAEDVDEAPEVELDEEEYLEGDDVELVAEDEEPTEEPVEADTAVEGTGTEITAPAEIEITANEPSSILASETIDTQQAGQGNVAVESEAHHTGPEEAHAALESSNAEVDAAAEPELEHKEAEAQGVETEAQGDGEELEAEEGDEGVYDLLTYDTLPPIVLTLPNASRALFNLSTPEDGEAGSGTTAATPVWFEDKVQELAEGTLSQLWAAIRLKLEEEGLGNGVDEMVISEKLTDLKMGDSDVNLEDITFLELVQMYHDCGLPEPMELHVEFQPHRFITRFNAIQKELQAREVVFVEDDEDAGGEDDVEVAEEDDEKHEEAGQDVHDHEDNDVEQGEQTSTNEAETGHGQVPVPLPDSHQDLQPSKALTVEVTSDETTADPTSTRDTADQIAEETTKPTPAAVQIVTPSTADTATAANDTELAGTPELRPVEAGNPPGQPSETTSDLVEHTAAADQASVTISEKGDGADTLLTSAAPAEPEPSSSAVDVGAAQAADDELEAAGDEQQTGAEDPQSEAAADTAEDAQHDHGNVEVAAADVESEEYADEGEYDEGADEYAEDEEELVEQEGEEEEEEEGAGDDEDPYGVDKFVDGVDDGVNGDAAAGDGEEDEEVYEEYEEEDAEYEGEEDELAPDAPVDPEHPHGLDAQVETEAKANGNELHDDEADVAASPVKRTRSTEEEEGDEEEVAGKRAKLAEPEPEAEA